MRVGGDVYVYSGDAENLALLRFRAEEEERCSACGNSSGGDDRPLVECDRCLRGFHMDCCEPPLRRLSTVGHGSTGVTVGPSLASLTPVYSTAPRTGDMELPFLLARGSRETAHPRTHAV